MRTLACISLIAAMSLAVPCAGAASPQEERGLAEIQVRAPVSRSWYMNPQQLSEMPGAYALSNGQSLRLTLERGRLYAELNRHGETELVPVAENMFVASDRGMALEYRPVAFGDEVVFSYKAELASAEPGFVSVHLALNR